MNILVVEDDQFKYSKVATILLEKHPDAKLTHKDNVHGAIVFIKENTPDLIILDMSLPSHPAVAGEGSPLSMPAGGIEIILELKYLQKTSIPVLVLTQYPDVEIENEYYSINESAQVIRDLFGIESISVINYDNDSQIWAQEFIIKLEKK